MTTIRWMALKKACEALLNNDKKVEITLSTTISDSIYNAILESNEKEVSIFLNASSCKNIDMVIEALAHELSHEIIKNPSHKGLFEKRKKEAKEYIKNIYYSC